MLNHTFLFNRNIINAFSESFTISQFSFARTSRFFRSKMRVNSKKAAVYELNKQGRTVPEIAKLLNMDRSNIRRSLNPHRLTSFLMILANQGSIWPCNKNLLEIIIFYYKNNFFYVFYLLKNVLDKIAWKNILLQGIF